MTTANYVNLIKLAQCECVNILDVAAAQSKQNAAATKCNAYI